MFLKIENKTKCKLRVILEPWGEAIDFPVGAHWIVESEETIATPELQLIDGAVVIACMPLRLRSVNGEIVWENWEWK